MSQSSKNDQSPEKQLSVKKTSSSSLTEETVSNRAKAKLSKTRSYSSHDYQVTVASIQNTVYEHASFLLNNYRLKQLFGMFANLIGFDISKWLHQYLGVPVVNNYVLALSSIHFDFNWPYPILINQHKKSKFLCLLMINVKKIFSSQN